MIETPHLISKFQAIFQTRTVPRVFLPQGELT